MFKGVKIGLVSKAKSKYTDAWDMYWSLQDICYI